MTPRTNFRDKAPVYMRKLMSDFPLAKEGAAAIMGNAGHESLGLTILQEIKPLAKGSRGGWGWFQWTGPRRRAFENYCKLQGLDPASDEANYGFLVFELRTTEKKAVDAVRNAKTLKDKVEAFEIAFERAGIKHYERRLEWAELALQAFNETVPPIPDVEKPVPPAVEPLPKPAAKGLAAAIIAALIAAGAVIYQWITKGN